MNDQLDVDVLKAGADLLHTDETLTVYRGQVPNGAARPYVRVHAWTAWPKAADSNALDGRSRTIYARWSCHCVGDTDVAAIAVGQAVRALLLDKVLTVPGHSGLGVDPIEQESSNPPVLDEITGQTVYDVIAVYKARVTVL